MSQFNVASTEIRSLTLNTNNLVDSLRQTVTSPNVMRSRSYNPWCEWVKTVSSELWSKFDPIIICFNQIDARISTKQRHRRRFLLFFSFFVSSADQRLENDASHPGVIVYKLLSISSYFATESYNITIINVLCQAVFTLSDFFQKLKEVCDNLKFEFM